MSEKHLSGKHPGKHPRRYMTRATLVKLLRDEMGRDLADIFDRGVAPGSSRRRCNVASLVTLPKTAKLLTKMVEAVFFGGALMRGEPPSHVKVRVHLPGRHSMLVYMASEDYFGLPQF